MANPSVQSILDVQDVRDDAIIVRDGSIRAVLAAASVNFELKSTDEQEAIVLRYQSFLNALDFSVQILVQSRPLDISPYIQRLRDRQREQTNELLRIQIGEYARFIEEFVGFANIMQKRFYVVIPFTPLERTEASAGVLGGLKTIWSPEKAAIIDDQTFRSYRDQLFQRVLHVETTLGAAGIQTQRLNSEQLTALLFHSYNPGVEGGSYRLPTPETVAT